MTEIQTEGPTRHTWKILIPSGILLILALFIPSCYYTNRGYYDASLFLWYFGSWVGSYHHPYYGLETDSGGVKDIFDPVYADKYIGLATGVIIMIIIAAIMMFVSSGMAKYGRNNKAALVTSAIGTILAFLGPGVYYGYLDREFTMPPFWDVFDEGPGFYLPIIAGVLGVIATGFNIYAVTLEVKGEGGRVIEKYQPSPEAQVDVQTQQRVDKFCPNCGAKLTGPYCQECGTKVY